MYLDTPQSIWYKTAHPSAWPKSRTWTTPTATKDVGNQELPLTAGGNAKWYSLFGSHLGSFIQN